MPSLNATQKALYDKEGWKLYRSKESGLYTVVDDKKFKLIHPYYIHAALYRDSENQEYKFSKLKKMRDYAWPHYIPVSNYWADGIMWEFCDDSIQEIVLAGGGSIGKSMVCAQCITLDYTSDPTTTAAIVASTDLDSLEKRIYGYVRRLVEEFNPEIGFKFQVTNGQKPKIKFKKNDKVHAISAVPSKKGGESQSISHLIGLHPKKNLLMVIDEATDCPAAVLKAKANLEKGIKRFKMFIVGNSDSPHDLHGAAATPMAGWASVTMNTPRWITATGGVCLYFNPYKSPAILETDPIKKEVLSQYFMTHEKIAADKAKYGEDSPDFWRFTLGFWPPVEEAKTILTQVFLQEFHAEQAAEWTGLKDVYNVAGLDPAFTQGGDNCILRIATLGTDIYGKVLLDYKGVSQLHKIEIKASANKSPELQIADQVIPLLQFYNIRLDYLAIDANGQGRGIADIIKLRANSVYTPIKIWATAHGHKNIESQSDLTIRTSYELWMAVRDFIQEDAIRGMDVGTLEQFCARLLIRNEKTKVTTLESKKEFKLRMAAKSPRLAHSPDEADAATLALQAAILKFGFSPGQTDLLVLGDNTERSTFLSQGVPEEVKPVTRVSTPILRPSFKSLSPSRLPPPILRRRR